MTDREQGFRIEEREQSWLTGIAISGPFEIAEAQTNEAWQRLAEMADAPPNALNRDEWLSACHMRETELTCYVGRTSDGPVGDLPDELVSIRIPRHEYLVARHSGSREELGNLYAAMFAWLHRKDRELNREILWLERFEAPPDPRDDHDLEIWLPLREGAGPRS
ncbi:MAG TPA: effector binding domain-containing protein [Thermomicrobiales bacterium]|nr:effector binding domain-containing protein [Thermomicrobiales bacterium]